MTKNLVLIGMMGSGKSAIAKALGVQLKVPALSTDAWVEKKAGASIKDIVATKGWPHFRALEHEAVLALSRETGVVIDCGGGVVLDPKNLNALKTNGIIFHLHVTPEVIYGRVKDDAARPLVNVPNPLAEIKKIYKERLPLYDKADFTIDTSDPSMEGAVMQILAKV